MATTYTGLRVQDTYNAIIKIGDNSNLSGTAKLLSDGLGNDSPLYLSGTRLGIGISPAYQFHTSGNAKIGGNLIVSGNLTVNGTLTYLNVQDLAVEDPLIKLAKDNTANTLDIGFFGKYVESATTKYTGLFWDASTDKFRLYEGLQVEPTTTVDVTGTGYTRSLLNADLEGNVTGTVSSLSNHDTNDLVEGSVNQYFTTTRARASFTEGTGVTITAGEIAIGQDVATDSDVTFGDITGSAISGTTGTFSGDLSANNLSGTNTGDQTLPTDFVSKTNGGTFSGSINITEGAVNGTGFASNRLLRLQNTSTTDGSRMGITFQGNSTIGSGLAWIEGVSDDQSAGHTSIRMSTYNGSWHTDAFILGADGNATFTGLVTGIAPTSDLNFATKKYVDDNIPTITTPALSAVLAVGNTSGSNNLIIQDNDELILGSGTDFRAYHNETNTIFRINTGDLIFNSFVDDGDIKFQLDDGSDPSGVTEYMRLDGGVQRVIYGRSIQMVDNVNLYFGNTVADDANIKWDSTAEQLFIGGQIKFLDDIYVLGKTNLNDADIDDTLAFYVSSTDAARQRADARDDDTNYARLHWFGKSDDGSTSNFRHAYYDGAAYINVTAQNNILTYTGALKVAPASGDGILFLQSTSQALRIDQNSLRTTTNTQFTFMTNSTSALQLDTSQNAIFYANLYMPQYLKHSGDENTYLQFQTDRQTLVAGGTEFIDFANTTQDYITIGGGSDIDIKLVSSTNNKYIFIQGSDGKIGINDQTPSYAFDVNAETRFGSAVNFDNTRYNKGGSATFWYATTTGARVNMDARVDGTGVVIHKWNRNADDNAYLSYAENWYDGNSYHKISAYNNGFMLNGNIRFESYGAGNITGTLSRLVGFEANGGLIDVPLSTFIDGSGVAGRIPYFTDASSLTSSSLFFENSDKIRHLQTIGPNDDVRKGFCVEDQTSMAANVGGQLTFRYMYLANGGMTEGAMIRMYKLNATDGDYSSGLKFQVRNTGDGLSSKMTLNPSGFLGLGTTDPQQPLHIQSTGDVFTRYQANSNANGVQFQTWHGNSQTMTINSNTTNPFAVYVGSASGTIAINISIIIPNL